MTEHKAQLTLLTKTAYTYYYIRQQLGGFSQIGLHITKESLLITPSGVASLLYYYNFQLHMYF